MELKLKKSALEEMIWKSIRLTMADNSIIFTMYYKESFDSIAKYEVAGLFPKIYKVNLVMDPSIYEYPREKLFSLATKSNGTLDTILEVPYSAPLGTGIRYTKKTYGYLNWASKRYNIKATAHTHPGNLKWELHPPMPSENDHKNLECLGKMFGKDISGIIIANTSHYALQVWTKYFSMDKKKIKIPKPKPRYLKKLTREAFQLWMEQFNKSPPDFIKAYDSKGREASLEVI